jgi:hypothetical protein
VNIIVEKVNTKLAWKILSYQLFEALT